MPDSLSPIRATLRTLTFAQQPPPAAVVIAMPACSGEYDCICDVCTMERIRRVRGGVKQPRQPWDKHKAA